MEPSTAGLSITEFTALARRPEARYLLRGGTVLTMDQELGDLGVGDVLVESGRIAAVGARIHNDAPVIDMRGRILIPGFVNSHHHMFQTALRGYWADALAADYFEQSRHGEDAVFHVYEPEDVYWGELAGALEQINAGITTVVDTSQCTETPAHTDAAIGAIKASGVRAVFAYCARAHGSAPAAEYAYPQDAARLIAEHFSDPDRLVGFAMGSPVDEAVWRFAGELGVPLYTHVNDRAAGIEVERLLRVDAAPERSTFIHCTGLADNTWDAIAQHGVRVSLSNLVEQTLSTGLPGLQHALRRDLDPAISTDAVTLGPTDPFSLMRATIALQRSRIQELRHAGAPIEDDVLDTRDIVRMATLWGARAAHLDDRVGSLTPGKRADIVALDATRINAAPLHHATGTIVMLMDTSNVETVIIDGRVRKAGGTLVDVDVEDVIDHLTRSGHGLVHRSRLRPILLDSCR